METFICVSKGQYKGYTYDVDHPTAIACLLLSLIMQCSESV